MVVCCLPSCWLIARVWEVFLILCSTATQSRTIQNQHYLPPPHLSHEHLHVHEMMSSSFHSHSIFLICFALPHNQQSSALANPLICHEHQHVHEFDSLQQLSKLSSIIRLSNIEVIANVLCTHESIDMISMTSCVATLTSSSF